MILAALRNATGPAHERVEQLLPLFDPALSLEQYAATLEMFHTLYAPLEAAVANALRESPLRTEAAQRAKLPLLQADLFHLGRSREDLQAFPPALCIPDLPTPAHALGAMYVMEGATLGGQVIQRHISSALGLSVGRGLSFFSSYGDRAGAMWAGFRALLADAPATHHPHILQAAIGTFDCFEKTFTSHLRPAGA